MASNFAHMKADLSWWWWIKLLITIQSSHFTRFKTCTSIYAVRNYPCMLYKFQPFSTTKDLGKEYNSHCQLVPNSDDWILILDYDCMILCGETYQVIENAIHAY